MRSDLGGVTVHWTEGGLWLRTGTQGLLIDAPAGVADALGEELPRVHAVVLTGDRARSVVGLVELLTALEPHRLPELPLQIHFPLGAERGAMLAETWVRGWPDRYPVTLDAEMPGSQFSAGPFELHTMPLASAEPNWTDGTVVPLVSVGLRVEVAGRAIAWVPSTAPHRHVHRLCAGVDLAVVEVGRLPWPRTDRPSRLGLSDVLACCGDVGELWMPGDDGSWEGAAGSES